MGGFLCVMIYKKKLSLISTKSPANICIKYCIGWRKNKYMFIGCYASLAPLTWYWESFYSISKRETCNTSFEAGLVVCLEAQGSEMLSEQKSVLLLFQAWGKWVFREQIARNPVGLSRKFHYAFFYDKIVS